MGSTYKISKEDAGILRQLAETIAGIAATTKMKEKRELWRRLNVLDPVRPLIFCDPENAIKWCNIAHQEIERVYEPDVGSQCSNIIGATSNIKES